MNMRIRYLIFVLLLLLLLRFVTTSTWSIPGSGFYIDGAYGLEFLTLCVLGIIAISFGVDLLFVLGTSLLTWETSYLINSLFYGFRWEGFTDYTHLGFWLIGITGAIGAAIIVFKHVRAKKREQRSEPNKAFEATGVPPSPQG